MCKHRITGQHVPHVVNLYRTVLLPDTEKLPDRHRSLLVRVHRHACTGETDRLPPSSALPVLRSMHPGYATAIYRPAPSCDR